MAEFPYYAQLILQTIADTTYAGPTTGRDSRAYAETLS